MPRLRRSVHPCRSSSNTGYILLGLVPERASSTILDALFSERILAAAAVTGYVDLDGDGVEDSLAGVSYEAVSSSAWSAGALTGTASDLVRFMAALFGGELISEASLAAMIADPWPGYESALGIELITFRRREALGP